MHKFQSTENIAAFSKGAPVHSCCKDLFFTWYNKKIRHKSIYSMTRQNDKYKIIN